MKKADAILSVGFIVLASIVILVVGHCLALATYLYFTQFEEDNQPSGSGGQSNLRHPWVKNAAIDTGFALVGVVFHFIPHTSAPALVLSGAATFDAFAIVKLLYQLSDVGLVAAAVAVVLGVATNVVNNKLVLPFAVVFSVVLIVGRAIFNAKSSPHSSTVVPEEELNVVQV